MQRVRRTRIDVVCLLAFASAVAVIALVTGSASGMICPETSTGGTCGGGGGAVYVTSVSVTAPNAGASVQGTVTLSASVSTSGSGGGCLDVCLSPAGTPTGFGLSASSDGTAASATSVGAAPLEFYVDGIFVGSTTGSSISWNTLDPNNPFYDGVHSVVAWAYATNAMESQPVSFNLVNTKSTQYQASLSSTAVPQSMLDGSNTTKYPVDVTATNTSGSTWSSKYVSLHYRWYSPDPVNQTVIDGGSLPLTANVGSGGAFTFHPSVTPPTLAAGVDRADWKLRFDLYDSKAGVWFADKGNKPLDNPVIVNHSLGDALGLERYYHYVGEGVGAGMTHLVNVANGNSLLRWTPLDEPGRGLATVMDITYNTLEQKSESPLGNNFSLSISTLSRFGLPIDIHPNKADQIAGRSNKWISFVDGDGTPHRFDGHTAADGTTYWTEPPGVHLYLHSTANGYAFTRPDGVTFDYDANGYPLDVKDRNGNTITYTETVPASPADDPGKIGKLITAVTDAGGRAFTITYYTKDNAPKAAIRGKVYSITDHVGHELDFNYYYDGNLRQIIEKGDSTTPDRTFTFTYTTADGSGPAITDPAARQSPDPSTSNESTRLYSVIDPRGNETTFAYVTSGQDKWKLASSTDRLGNQTTYAYDDANQKTTVNLPLSRSWSYAYNAGGQVTTITNPLAQQTGVTWSPDLQVSSVTEPSGAKTSFTYNDNGYLTSTTDAQHNTSQLTYQNLAIDGNDVSGKWASSRSIPHLSQLATKTEPLGVAAGSGYTWTYSYDSNGNLTSVADPLGNTATNTYNADGTLATSSDADGHPPAQFTNYDANGLPQVVVDPLGHKTQFTYDAAGRLRSIQDPEHANFTDPSSTWQYQTQFSYDPFGRLISRSEPKSSVFEGGTLVWTDYSYDPNDNLTALTNAHYAGPTDSTAGIATTDFSYDAMDRQTQVQTVDPSDTPDPNGARVQTTYDAAGRAVKVVQPMGLVAGAAPNSYTTTYSYDPLDRLATTTQYDADGTTTRVTNDCYDLAGDLRSTTLPRGASTFTGCPAAGATYTPSNDPFTWTFSYDASHRLVSQTDPSGHTSSVTFDADGNVKTSTDANGTVTTYGYDQRNLLSQITSPFDTSTTPERDTVAKYERDGVGNVTRVISPRAYDASPDKSTFTDYVTSFHYDADNQLVRTDLPTDANTAPAYQYRCYDKDGRVAMISLPIATAIDPATITDCTQFDDQHNSVIDMTQKTLVYYFDPGWIRTLDDPADPAQHFQYSAEGWQTDRVPDNAAGQRDTGHEQTWTYDPLGLVTKTTHPAAADGTIPTSTYSYNANGWLTKATESGVYDTSAGDAPMSVTASYDGFGETNRIASQKSGDTSGNWNVTRYAYDGDGNVISRIDNQVEDGSANVVTAGDTQTFTFDSSDWMQTELDQKLNRRITETFMPTGWPQSRLIEKQASDGTWATKQKTTWSYFANGLLKTLATTNGTGDTLEQHSESYVDANNVFDDGNLVADHFALSGPNTACTAASPCDATYSYDAQDRLAKYLDGHGDTKTYGLDPAGDVTSVKTTDSTGSTLQANYTYHGTQLATQTDATGNVLLRYFYSDLGELLCVTLPAGAKSDCPAKRTTSLGSNVVQSYVYDPMRRLSDVQTAGSSTAAALDTHYAYDALDRVSQETEAPAAFSRATSFTYLGLSSQISGETQQTTVAGGSPSTSTTTYGYDADGVLTEMSNTGGPRPGTYGFGYDPRGNISMLIGQTGSDANTAVATYGYDPYGNADAALTKGDTGAVSSTNPGGAMINPFRFEARFSDAGSNTVVMGARHWGPDTFHFLEEDQYAGSLDDLGLTTDPLTDNRYDLAGANPINFVEADGHASVRTYGSFYLHEIAVALTVDEIALLHPGADITVGRWANFIPHAGKHGGPGYADIILWSKNHERAQVWEVKPDSPYGHATGGPQLERYVARLRALGVKARPGDSLPVRRLPLLDTQLLTVRSGGWPGPEEGVEFYSATAPLPEPLVRRIRELERRYVTEPHPVVHWGFNWRAGLAGALAVTGAAAALIACPETGGATCAVAAAAG